MILQALVNRYEDLLKKGAISEPGWGKANVSFGLNLNGDGEVIGLLSLKISKPSGKKTVLAPQSMEVPQPVKRSVDIKANFLCDNSTYIFGVDEKGNKERAKQCFCACRELHLKLLKNAESEAALAIIRFFEKWNPEAAQEKQYLSDNWKDLTAGANILFYYDGESVMANPEIRECWRNYYNNSDSGNSGICMVTGKNAPIAVLHPTIKGVRGAQAMGTSLVSFNAPSFCSYGKEQGGNAPVSEYAAFAYATALNELLNDREHTKAIGDTTVVCWAEGGDAVYQDVAMVALFGTEDEGGLTEQDLSMILSKIQKGDMVRFKDEWISPDRHFYILGLAPNAARLSVRFFMEDSFGKIVRHIQEHYERLEIVRPSNDKFTILPIWKLISETVNNKAKDKSPSPQMAADTLKAVLNGGAYPTSLLNGVMLRIRAERDVTRGRAAIIKAYYLRNKNKDCPKEVLKMELNEECRNVPYTLGRLFAVLEHIQQKANPGINATIKDKYFSAASATPARIFPKLIDLAQKHLRKLDEGRKINFNKKIGELTETVGTEYPMRLNLPQQGSFQLGYYHQTQKCYQKKEEK
ncbi:MAG: type I-C CRISPR-associated protein Cas8c/Csd1 [Butyrivibrio sp.]|nr:type I-C CRISPR-associated protein Cas8c/Csd1 [Butyrivibrio sp.]